MISFEDFLMQEECDKYNMLQECNAYIKSKDREIERLNNIINEIEKYAGLGEINWEDKYQDIMLSGKSLLKRIKELKGSNDPRFEEMVGFVENVCKDIKSQPTLHEELEEERKTISKIVGDFKEVNK